MKVRDMNELRRLVHRSEMATDNPATAAPQKAAEPNLNAEILSAIHDLSDAIAGAKTPATVINHPPEVQIQPGKWIFTIERDEDGLTSRIIAEASYG